MLSNVDTHMNPVPPGDLARCEKLPNALHNQHTRVADLALPARDQEAPQEPRLVRARLREPRPVVFVLEYMHVLKS